MLSKFSVNKPYTVIVGVIIILILGIISFYNTTTDLLPNINLPYIAIITTYPGASPEQIETNISRPLEQSMLTLSNIENIQSISAENISLVILEFNAVTNMDSAMIEIRENLGMLSSLMPSDASSPMLMRINPDLLPVSVLSVAVEDQTIAETSKFITDTIVPSYERILGVASVSTTGLVDEEIHITLDQEKIAAQKEKIEAIIESITYLPSVFMPNMNLTEMLQESGLDLDQLSELEITTEMISGIILGQNLNLPAGYLRGTDNSYLVKVGDRINSLDQLRELPLLNIPLLNQPIRLSDIAQIELLLNEGNTYTRLNGQPAVILSLQKQTDFSTADVASRIRNQTATLEEQYSNLQVTTLMDQGIYIDTMLDSVLDNIIYGGLLAAFILILFLRNLKPTLVVAFSIPISVITSFVLMYFSNISLNVISMGGLALGVGMLVDNSIVVIENIYRMRAEGKSAREAAVQGAKQVANAITASTITTMAVFLPVIFTQGLTREILSDMALTISYSLGSSLIVALTLVPMLASRLLDSKIPSENQFSLKLRTSYTKLIAAALNRKGIIFALVFILFGASIIGVWQMGTEFLPKTYNDQMTIQVSLPSDATMNDTTQVADQLTNKLETIDAIETVGIVLGGGLLDLEFGAGSGDHRSLTFYLLLKEEAIRKNLQIAEEIRELTSDINADIVVSESTLDLSAITGGAIAIDIMGEDTDTLQNIAMDVAEIVANTPGTTEVSDGLQDAEPEIRILVDKEKSIAEGLTVGQVLMAVNSQLDSSSAVTTLNADNKQYNVFINDGKEALSRVTLEDLLISSPFNDKVRLGDIATIEEGKGLSAIMRRNQNRYISVTAEVAVGSNTGRINREISRQLDDYQLPDGYSIEFGGEHRLITDSFDDLFLVLVLGIVLIYLIMVAGFQSFLSPLIVMVTIPLAFTGGFAGLILTNNPLSLVAVIGLVTLTGVVVNNGIVLIDYINQLREQGVAKREAIIEACSTRLRPILMTALTTIFGLATMTLGVGLGTELIQPMAITTSSGLIYATILTLFMVPLLYDLLHRE